MGSATQEQIMGLLDFLQDHPQLAKGNLRHLEARQESKRLWENIAQALNGLGGANKSAAQWQKVWADKKFTAKSKAAERARGATGTGGGPAVGGKLTEVDLRVLQIMGEGFGGPQTAAVVNPFETPDQVRRRLVGLPRPLLSVPQLRQPRLQAASPRENAPQQRLPATPSRQTAPQPCFQEAQLQQGFEEIEVIQEDEHSYALPPPEETSQEYRPPSRSQRNRRRRRLARNDSVERLVETEEEKIIELKKISTAVNNMTGVLNRVSTSLENLVEVLSKK